MLFPRTNHISIHLMLLFIFFKSSTSHGESSFQYISCYCLSGRRDERVAIDIISIHLMLLFIPNGNAFILSRIWYFNTSHVTVYRIILDRGQGVNAISIHLMLLFISCTSSVTVIYFYFNTSHVTVYQNQNSQYRKMNGNFNTSHVTVYHELREYQPTEQLFQYISCYCLSAREVCGIS